MVAPHRLLLAVIASLVCTAGPRHALAYSAPEAYDEPSSTGGGGGRWFSGSPAEGYGCSVCHLAAPGQRRFPLYVSGLPVDAGYMVGGRYEVGLIWPEFAARWRELRPDPTVPTAPGAPLPSVGLVAELVAESGKASGTIEIDAASAEPAELCEMTRPNLQPRLGAKLYQVRPGVEPLLVKPDAAGVLRCESRQLAQRCIVALASCGAHEIRMSWTAPPTWEGPIWFSAGFVASEALSGTPEQDAVQEISVPLVQAGAADGAYQQTLRHACAFARTGSQSRAGAGVFFVAAMVLLGRRTARVARRRG